MEQSRKPDLYLITQDFPYGPIEDSFVKPEYPYLCERFHVSIIAAELSIPEESVSEDLVTGDCGLEGLVSEDASEKEPVLEDCRLKKSAAEDCGLKKLRVEDVGEKRSTSRNAAAGYETDRQEMKACLISKNQSTGEKLRSLIRFLCEKDCYTEIAAIIKSRRKIPQRIYRALMFGAAAETFYRRLQQKISLTKETQAVFYFYWFDYKCFGLTMHRRKFPQIRIVARTHGYELFDERELYGRQFFKPQMDKEVDRLVFAAQYAKDYYLTRYQLKDSEKYPLYRLGVPDRKVTVEERRKTRSREELLLVSCSGTGRIKRIDRIIDGLSSVPNAQIHWVHIGGGEELDALCGLAEEKLKDKSNIRYEFTGTLSNEDVIAYYQNHYVSCFITTTETEGGSPVSVQEALSFGVPVIATAVGELVQMVDDNGILLSEKPTGEEVAQAVERMTACYGTEEYFQMCGRSLEIFHERFDEQRNFTAFAAELARAAY